VHPPTLKQRKISIFSLAHKSTGNKAQRKRKTNLHLDLRVLQEYHFGLLACKYDMKVPKKLSTFNSREPLNGSFIFTPILMGAIFVLNAGQYLQS